MPRIAQSGVNKTNVTVEGIQLSEPTPNSYRFSTNTTERPKSIFTPTLDPFNVSFYLTDYDNNTAFQVAEFPRTHVHKPTLVNVTDQLIHIENMPQWEQYLRVAFASDYYRVTNLGHTDLHLGALPTTNIEFRKFLTIPGLGGLRTISTSNISIDIQSQQNNFRAITTIPNPSTSIITLGNLTYDTYIAPNNTYIGKTNINDVTLYPGNNTFPLVASTVQAPVIAALGVRPYCQTGNVELTLVPSNLTYNGVEIPYLLQSLTNISQTLPVGQAIEKATDHLLSYYCADSS